MLTGTTLAGLMTGASFGPPSACLGPQAVNGHRKSLCKRIPGSNFVSSSSPLPSFLCVCSSSPPQLHRFPVLAALDHHHSSYALSVVLLFYPRLFAADNACVMPPKKSPEAILQRAREKGSESNREGIDDTIVQGRILPDTEKSYDSRMNLWEA
jgi:hypothetical protein